jgi:hypothetical protein
MTKDKLNQEFFASVNWSIKRLWDNRENAPDESLAHMDTLIFNLERATSELKELLPELESKASAGYLRLREDCARARRFAK